MSIENQAVAGEETEGDVLAKQAYDEMEGKEAPEVEVKKKPEESEAEPAEKQPESEEAEPSDDKPAEKKEGEESEKSEEAPEGEEKKEESEPEDDVKIQAFAEKHSVTYAEAKEEISKAKAIVDKYKGDPIEMARAIRSQQSEFDKLKSGKEEKKESKPLITKVASKLEFRKDAGLHIDSQEGLKDKLIDKYREENPAQTELMTDEAILERVIDEKYDVYRQDATIRVEGNKKLASDKREGFIASIPKEDVKFLNDVKVILDNTPDSHVLSDKFDISDLLWHAKGQRYDTDTKSAYQRGLKDGKEQPKILGTKESGGGTTPKKPVGTSTVTEGQKNHALDMFPDSSEEQAIKSFQEVYADDLKKNSKFLPN